MMKRLRERWESKVAPHDKALREAAQAHYEVIESMRREQQRLIDEADRIQRAIDELQKQYQEMITPRPEPVR
jgi:chromosome segregation ATPase